MLLTVIDRDLPVLLEGPAPDTEVQDLREDVAEDAVRSNEFDELVLLQAKAETSDG